MDRIDRLISEYRAAASAHNEPDDGTSSWAERVNRAADRMMLISRQVASAGPDAVSEFGQLVGSDDPVVALWAAHHLLDFMNPQEPARDRALSVIRNVADSNRADASAEKEWLENWEAELQDE